MIRMSLAILLGGVLCGCTSLMTTGSRDLDRFVPARCSSEDVAALPAGAGVEVTNDSPDGRSRSRTTGTVLKGTINGVALFNCVVEQRNERGFDAANRIPYVSRLFPNTGVGVSKVPVLWVPLDEIGTVRVVAPPPEGTVPPDIPFEALSGEVPERLDSQGSLYRTHGGVI